MEFTPKIQKAINLAATLHDGQERKGDALPYIVHPFSVALILSKYSGDEDVILAGILHDTIEDTGYTKEQMEQEFGKRVTELVLDLTEKEKELPWQKRKDDYLAHLRTTGHESKLICAADKLHNLQSMIDAFRKFGDKALEKFNAPADKKIWFYEECLKIFREDEQMPKELITQIEELCTMKLTQGQPPTKQQGKQPVLETSQRRKPNESLREFASRMNKSFVAGLNRQVLEDDKLNQLAKQPNSIHNPIFKKITD